MAINPVIRNAFRQAFEANCMELVITAYQNVYSERKYSLDWLENDFSELLGHSINGCQKSIDMGIFCKTENKIVAPENNLTKGFGDRLPRIDFIYSKHWRKHRFDYFMEAKRLKEKDSNLKRAYINEGMDRFILKKYPLGCMLGYLLEGSSNKTVFGINQLLKKDKRSLEVLNFKNNPSYSSYFESEHHDIGIIKHLILNFV